jgi:laminin beta 1
MSQNFFSFKCFFCLKECDCNVAGTLNNLGCNKTTGECFACKPNVIGKQCNSCKQSHYGNLTDLSVKGCRACMCTVGFSYSKDCNSFSGQCDCIPNTYGRRCDRIQRGYFCANLDHILYEAELDATKISHRNHFKAVEGKYVRGSGTEDMENSNNNEMNHVKRWTGLGYLKVFTGEIIKFKVKHEQKTGMYDIALRYDVKNEYLYTDDSWEVNIKIVNLNSHNNYLKQNRMSNASCLFFNQNHISQKHKIQLENRKKLS